MKRLFFFICAFAILCSQSSFAAVEWDGTSFPWMKGTGTEADPYLIETPQHLSYLSEMVSAGINTYKDKYFKQTQDFDMKSHVFTPIGISATYSFNGKYDGNNKSIANLNISGDNDNDYIALFGYVVNATICNVIVDGNFKSTISKRTYAAGIVAYGSNSRVDNCKNKADIAIDSYYAAGIMGLAQGKCVITNCSNAGDVNSSIYTGGIIGIAGNARTNITTIHNCSNMGRIKSSYNTSEAGNYSHYSSAGGIVGYVQDTCILDRCSNTDSIYTTSKGVAYSSVNIFSYSGGIIGYDEYGMSRLNLCSNTGAIQSFAGYGNVVHSCSSGIIGYVKTTNTKGLISNCYARGNYASSMAYISKGLCLVSGIAKMYSTIANSYFTGILDGGSNYGICSDASSVRNCYFNSDCGASTSSGYGTAKTPAQFKSASMPILLNGSETGTTWVMDTNNSNDGYPIFGWQAAPTYKITAICDEAQGSVSGGGNYTEGTVVTLAATPKEGYIFSGWGDGDKTNPRSVTVGTSDVTYTALFVKMRYVITVNQDCSVNVQ